MLAVSQEREFGPWLRCYEHDPRRVFQLAVVVHIVVQFFVLCSFYCGAFGRGTVFSQLGVSADPFSVLVLWGEEMEEERSIRGERTG